MVSTRNRGDASAFPAMRLLAEFDLRSTMAIKEIGVILGIDLEQMP